MEHISNEEKAIELAENISPYDIGGDNVAHYAAKDAALDAMWWKDKQHEQEKQQMIERTVDWVQKEATKHIGFNAISEECSLSWDFTDLLVKAMKGE